MDKTMPYLDIARYYDTGSIGATKTKPRVVESYEASIYLNSGGQIIINNEMYLCEKYSVRFNKPGDIVYSIPHFTCLTINFNPGKWLPELNSIIDGIDSFFYGNNKIVSIFEKIITHFKADKEIDDILNYSYLLRLIAEFHQICNSPNTYSDTVDLCISYIEKNFSQKITLDTLGELTGYSPLHLSRIFLKEMQKTPHQFLTEVRLDFSKQKLSETNEKISEIANECGFLSESHFKAFFKKMTGKTPGMYRREMSISI